MSNEYIIILNADDAKNSINDTHKIFYLDHSDLNTPKHLLIGVSGFNMPYTFHTFHGSNNSFVITTLQGATELSQTVTIDQDTTYSISELMSLLNTKFTTIKVSLGLTNLSIRYDSGRNKCYVSCAPMVSALTFGEVLCYKQLGFTSPTEVYLYTNALNNNYFPKCPDLSGPGSLYIRLHNKKIRSYNTKKVDGIICNIPCTVWNTNIIFYHVETPQYHYAYGDLQHIEISILDSNLEPIQSLDIPTSSFHMTLSVIEQYEEPKT